MWFRSLFTLPTVEDDETAYQASLLTTAATMAILALTIPIVTVALAVDGNWDAFASIGATILVNVLVLIGAKRGWVKLASWVFVMWFWSAIILLSFWLGGVRADPMMYIMVSIVNAGLILGWQGQIFVLSLTVLAGSLMVYAEGHGYLRVVVFDRSITNVWLNELGVWVLTAVFSAIAVARLSRQRAALRHKNSELQAIRLTLEEKVEDRTRELLNANAQLQEKLTEIEKAQIAINQNNRRYRALFENNNDAVFLIGLDLRHLAVNSKACQLFGYTAEEFTGMSVSDMVAPGEYTNSVDVFNRLLTREDLPLYERAFLHKDGHPVLVEVNAAMIFDEDGQPLHVQSIVRDITERKQAAQKLEIYAADLERSNKELQEFAFIASHDLKEPLRKIQIFGERLKARLKDKLDDSSADYLARMQNASERMQILINDLLSYSRVSTKGNPFTAVNLDTLLHEVLSDLEARIESTRGTVQMEPLPTISADPTQMRQLLQNLIGNALKFHQPDLPPIIKITSEPISQNGTLFCRLTVADNGIGFDQKYADQIFGMFQRLQGRAEYEGTGVGLAICRKIVERHGGTITANSQENVGTTFTILLPTTHQTPPES